MPTPGPTPLQVQGQSNIKDFPFAETLDDPSLQDAHFGHEMESRATVTIQVDFDAAAKYPNDFQSKLLRLIGYAYRAGGSLCRKIPMQHPLFSCMTVKEISGIRLKGYRGKVNTPTGVTGQYTRADVTLAFVSQSYAMLNDQQVAQVGGADRESQRFVEKKYNDATRVIMSDKGACQYSRGPVGFMGSQIIKQGMPIIIGTGHFKLIWHQVPRRWVYGNGSRATNILHRVGMVNDTDFFDYPAGTLLLEYPDIKPFTLPMPTENWQLGQEPPELLTIVIPFKVYDPPIGLDGQGNFTYAQPGGNPEVQGHNARPHPADPDGLAYPVVQVASGASLYQATTMGLAFAPVQF